jgi:hypothetical protein
VTTNQFLCWLAHQALEFVHMSHVGICAVAVNTALNLQTNWLSYPALVKVFSAAGQLAAVSKCLWATLGFEFL